MDGPRVAISGNLWFTVQKERFPTMSTTTSISSISLAMFNRSPLGMEYDTKASDCAFFASFYVLPHPSEYLAIILGHK